MIGRTPTLLAACLLLAGLSAPSPANAAGEAKHPHAIDWSFGGPFGTYDRSALRRGFQVYKEV